MPSFTFEPHSFMPKSLETISHAKRIIGTTFKPHGFTPTLRQLYYRFVAENLMANTLRNYKSFGSLMVKARLAGAIPIDAFEDRTRFLRGKNHMDDIESALEKLARDYLLDKWLLSKQKNHIEVWVEKDALIEVVQRACEPLDVWYFACRGNPSLTSLWQATERLERWSKRGCKITILYLGDHDANGLDIPRAIQASLDTLTDPWQHSSPWRPITIDRIALTMAQVEQYDLPSQPAKLTDSRANAYARQFGNESWELDALEPMTMMKIIQDAILKKMEQKSWNDAADQEEVERETVQAVAENYDDVERWLMDQGYVEDPDYEGHGGLD